MLIKARSLLFLIYVNDIHNAIPEVNIKLFADDTNIFIHNRDSTRLRRKANLCLKQINEWFVANKLSLRLVWIKPVTLYFPRAT